MIKIIAFILLTLFCFLIVTAFKFVGVYMYVYRFNSISPLLQLELDFKKEHVFVIRSNSGTNDPYFDELLTVRRTMDYFYKNYGILTVITNFKYIVDNEISMFFALVEHLRRMCYIMQNGSQK